MTEAERIAELEKALGDLVDDLEERSKFDRDTPNVVACGDGVYKQALRALGRLDQAAEELEPHEYKPDLLHGMGDCKICGRVEDDPIHDMEEPDACPECGAPIKPLMSGVKCSKCDYWFCY